jgi:hypothetical protein
LYAKHTIFYDALPHYFMEFDVLDTATDEFLDTPRRATLLRAVPVVPVRVLFEGVLHEPAQLTSLLGASAFKTGRVRQCLRAAALRQKLDADEIERQTDLSPLMEGLYIKVEEDGVVRERYKFVRHDFVTRITDADSHWLMRPIIANELCAGADIFAGEVAS